KSVEPQETLDVSRYTVVVVVAAQILIEGLLLWYGRMEHVADEPLDGLCRSLEALALRSSLDLEVALPIACAVVREAQEAEGLWPLLPLRGGVSLGKAPKRDETGLFGGEFEPELVQPLCQQPVDAERIRAVLKAEYKIVQIADPIGFAL